MDDVSKDLTTEFRVSGPVSLYVLQDRNDAKWVTLFGDEHFSSMNQCRNCKEDPRCLTTEDFISRTEYTTEARVSPNKRRELDVFVEFPYLMRSGFLRETFMKYIDRYMGYGWQTTTMSAKKKRKLRRKVVFSSLLRGVLSSCIPSAKRSQQHGSKRNEEEEEPAAAAEAGMLGVLYRAFRDKVYNPSHAHDSGKNIVRYHASDVRWEPNMWMYIKAPPFFPIDRFHRWMWDFCCYFSSVDTYGKLIETFLYSADFPGNLRALLGERALVTYSALSTLSDTDDNRKHRLTHKIAKQYHSLEKVDASLQQAVRRYLDDRLREILESMKNGASFDSMDSATERWTNICASEKRMRCFVEVVHIRTPGLLMDAYLLCRMLRFLYNQTSPVKISKAIVYAGQAHIGKYIDFLENYLGFVPLQKQDPWRPPSTPYSSYSRCVKLGVTPFLRVLES